MDITLQELLASFSQYNELIWPFQFLAFALSLIGLYYAFKKNKISDWVIIGIMIFFYLWNAFIFWLPMALDGYSTGYVFISIFVFQAGYLLYAGIKKRLSFDFHNASSAIIGLVIIAYGLLFYPLVGLLIGRQYPALIFSPFCPCILNIYVMGMLLLTDKPIPRCLVMTPFVWGIIGFFFVTMGLTEDIVLILVNILGAILVWSRDLRMMRKQKEALAS